MNRRGTGCSTDPGPTDEPHERCRAAVHDGQLHGVHLDECVVHAQTRESRHQVFHGGDPDLPAAQARGELGVDDILGTGLDVCVATEVGTNEHDAGVRWRRADCQLDVVARVQPHPRGSDLFREGSLSYQVTQPVLGPSPRTAPRHCRPILTMIEPCSPKRVSPPIRCAQILSEPAFGVCNIVCRLDFFRRARDRLHWSDASRFRSAHADA